MYEEPKPGGERPQGYQLLASQHARDLPAARGLQHVFGKSRTRGGMNSVADGDEQRRHYFVGSREVLEKQTLCPEKYCQ